jgi:hypothetical protein
MDDCKKETKDFKLEILLFWPGNWKVAGVSH